MDALKEWATVVKALENGEQTVILRKGGILETASGFKIEAKKFLLFRFFLVVCISIYNLLEFL